MAPAKRSGAHNRHHQLKQLSGGVKRLFGKLSVAIIVLVICTLSLLSSTKTYKPPTAPKVTPLPIVRIRSFVVFFFKCEFCL